MAILRCHLEIDSVSDQLPPTLHDPVEGSLPAAVNPVGVVDLARAIDAQTDQKIVFLEEGPPVVIEKNAIGLKGVLDYLAGPPILLDDFDGAPEEIELHQRRLAALPRHCYLERAVRLQQLPDVGLERVLGHPLLIVRIQCLLRQEEAILAVNVAGCPARLRQQVEARRRIDWQRGVSYRRHFYTFVSIS